MAKTPSILHPNDQHSLTAKQHPFYPFPESEKGPVDPNKYTHIFSGAMKRDEVIALLKNIQVLHNEPVRFCVDQSLWISIKAQVQALLEIWKADAEVIEVVNATLLLF
ncbi:MAG: hypothetical protein WAV51_00190 [Microgenomates group bacterium]